MFRRGAASLFQIVDLDGEGFDGLLGVAIGPGLASRGFNDAVAQPARASILRQTGLTTVWSGSAVRGHG